jgi:PKHD-type hydroxylase
MPLNNYYWYFVSALSNQFCDSVIKFANQKQKLIATTGQENKNINKVDKKKLFKTRKSEIVWLDEKWIYKEIHPFVHLANKNANWNFQWDISEQCQFTIYKKTQHYHWHVDQFDNPMNTPNNLSSHGKIRKLSVTISLSDPKDYKGGELQFDFRNKDNGKPNIKTATEILPRGSICVFPSFVWHRVKPVTKGTRYSLVMWNLGNPYI